MVQEKRHGGTRKPYKSCHIMHEVGLSFEEDSGGATTEESLR